MLHPQILPKGMDTFVLSSLSSSLNFLWIVWRAGNMSKHCMQMWASVYMCAETRALTLGSFSVVLHITFGNRNSHSICAPIGETSWPVSCRHSPTSVPLREGVPSTLQSLLLMWVSGIRAQVLTPVHKHFTLSRLLPFHFHWDLGSFFLVPVPVLLRVFQF